MPAINFDSMVEDSTMEVFDIEIESFDAEDEIVSEIEVDLGLFFILSLILIIIAFLIKARNVRST